MTTAEHSICMIAENRLASRRLTNETHPANGSWSTSEESAGEIVTATAVEESLARTGPEAGTTSLLGLVELILKRRDYLELLIREPALQSQLVPRFLAISLVAFIFFGVSLSLVFNAAGEWPRLNAVSEYLAGRVDALILFEANSVGEIRVNRWLDGSATTLVAAYAIGLIAATGVCLPSLYFYGLLAGVRMTMLDVVIHALKSKAIAAVALIGILPIYAALGLGIVIFDLPEMMRNGVFWLGLMLPFLAGIFGTHSLYCGFAGLIDTLPPDRRCQRECFLRRLVLSWSACYTAVTPVMIHTLWVALNAY